MNTFERVLDIMKHKINSGDHTGLETDLKMLFEKYGLRVELTEVEISCKLNRLQFSRDVAENKFTERDQWKYALYHRGEFVDTLNKTNELSERYAHLQNGHTDLFRIQTRF